MIDDGSYVAYTGRRPSDGVQSGDEGIVVVASDSGSYVNWYSGTQAGKITLVANSYLDLVDTPVAHHAVSYDELGLEDTWETEEADDLLEDGWY